MRIKDFDDWFDAYGFQIEETMYNFLKGSPYSIDNIDDIVDDILNTQYETYVADYNDYIYEEMRDRQYED